MAETQAKEGVFDRGGSLKTGPAARALDACGKWWSFNGEGRVDEDMHQRMLERLDLLPVDPSADPSSTGT